MFQRCSDVPKVLNNTSRIRRQISQSFSVKDQNQFDSKSKSKNIRRTRRLFDYHHVVVLHIHNKNRVVEMNVIYILSILQLADDFYSLKYHNSNISSELAFYRTDLFPARKMHNQFLISTVLSHDNNPPLNFSKSEVTSRKPISAVSCSIIKNRYAQCVHASTLLVECGITVPSV